MATSIKKEDPLAIGEDNLLEVRCGDITGVLHRDKFICPGKNELCIEINGDLVSPRFMTQLAQRDRRKDWKGSIRIHKYPIRKHMDFGKLDFHNHQKYCTMQCMSKKRLSEQINGDMFAEPHIKMEGSSSKPERAAAGGHQVADHHEYAAFVNFVRLMNSGVNSYGTVHSESENTVPNVNNSFDERAPSLAGSESIEGVGPATSLTSTMTDDGVGVVANTEHTADSQARDSEPNLIGHGRVSLESFSEPTSEFGQSSIEIAGLSEADWCPDDPVRFWKGIQRLGLVEEFVVNIKAALEGTKQTMLEGEEQFEEEAIKLTRVVKELGLFDDLKLKLALHRTEMEEEQEKLRREMEEMKKRLRENETKQMSLKRKTQCFSDLEMITSPTTPPKVCKTEPLFQSSEQESGT